MSGSGGPSLGSCLPWRVSTYPLGGSGGLLGGNHGHSGGSRCTLRWLLCLWRFLGRRLVSEVLRGSLHVLYVVLRIVSLDVVIMKRFLGHLEGSGLV